MNTNPQKQQMPPEDRAFYVEMAAATGLAAAIIFLV